MASLALALVCAACGGTPNTPDGSVVNYPGNPGGGGGQYVQAGVFITVPPSHGGLRDRYLSSATRSISIQAASANGGAVTGVTASTIDTVKGAPSCKPAGKGLFCSGKVEAVAGQDVFNVTAFAWRGGNGPVLSAGQVSASITGSNSLSITSGVSLTLNGVVAKLRLALTPASAHIGKTTSSQVALTAYDAAGAAIVGRSAYQTPIALTIQGDAASAFTLRANGTRATTLTVLKPESGIALDYDGSPNGTSVVVQASVAGGGTGAPSASAPFQIVGVPPPPKGGPIYALNVGSKQGRSATVTVYDPTANGNVAPVRTLQLSSTLYAQSVAVDSKNNLYVGFFDSTLGFDPVTHLPDAGNEIAVYAPNASGSDQPVSILKADPATSTTIFPSSVTFDPSGELVTFGATLVSGSAADSVLVYDAYSGAVAPAHAWNFASPNVSYPGVAGIALDAAGNFYVDGALHTSLGPNNGVFVASAADRDNPSASVARSIPWDPTTRLTNGAVGVALDRSGEIHVANALQTASGSTVTCSAQINAFAAGSTGGVTDSPPLHVIAIDGFTTTNPLCSTSNEPLAAAFPAVVVFGTSLYAASDFNNALAVIPVGASGSVKPAQTIAGSSTQLNVPIAIAVGPASPAGARASLP